MPAPSRNATPCTDFVQLALPLEKALYTRALGLERSPQDARDLVQDTFERGLRHFGQFQRGTNMKMWLFRIMYNLFIDRYRRRVPEQAQESIEGLELAAPEANDPDVWEAVDSQQIQASVQQLEPRFRSVIEMHFIDRRSYREIGTRLGLPTGTVGTRLLRARLKLRDLMTAQLCL